MAPNRQRRPGYRRRFSPINQERFGVSWDQEPPAPDRTRDLAELVTGVLKEAGCAQHLQHQQILDAWPTLVGPDIARRARPGPIENQTLAIYVTSSAWLNELARYGQRQILAKIQHQFGPKIIRNVRLQLDPDLNR
jgi:predicted nucleic acid-binding Zn ribbon protein